MVMVASLLAALVILPTQLVVDEGQLSAADLDTQIKEKEAEIEKAEKFFTDEVDKLQKSYQKLQEDKESTITAVKDSGLGLMKSTERYL